MIVLRWSDRPTNSHALAPQCHRQNNLPGLHHFAKRGRLSGARVATRFARCAQPTAVASQCALALVAFRLVARRRNDDARCWLPLAALGLLWSEALLGALVLHFHPRALAPLLLARQCVAGLRATALLLTAGALLESCAPSTATRAASTDERRRRRA